MQDRKETYSEDNPNGRWRKFTISEDDINSDATLKLDFKCLDLTEKDNRTLSELLEDIRAKSSSIVNAIAELEKLIDEVDE